jgi:cbb3-type cytochrome oxidase subunit 1
MLETGNMKIIRNYGVRKILLRQQISRRLCLCNYFWAIVGMLVGVIIAFQLAYPALNLGIAQTTLVD